MLDNISSKDKLIKNRKERKSAPPEEMITNYSDPKEELNDLVRQRKNYLMELFTKSGEAKLPAILKQLKSFLDNPISGKVACFLISNYNINYNQLYLFYARF